MKEEKQTLGANSKHISMQRLGEVMGGLSRSYVK